MGCNKNICIQEKQEDEIKKCCKCCKKQKKKKRKPCDVCCKSNNPNEEKKPSRCCCKEIVKCEGCRCPPSLFIQAMRKGETYFQRCAFLNQINTDAIYKKYGITKYTTPGLNIFEEYLPIEPPPKKKKRKKMTKAEKEEMLRANGIDPRYADKATGFYAKAEDNKVGPDFYDSLPNKGKGSPHLPKEGRLIGVHKRHVRCFLENESSLFHEMKHETDEKNQLYLEKEKERQLKLQEKMKRKAARAARKKRKGRKKKQPEIDYLEFLNNNFEECNRKMLAGICQNIVQKCIEEDKSCRNDDEKAMSCINKCPHTIIDINPKKSKKKKRRKKQK